MCRLNDVRFLGLGLGSDWIKIADLKTARWGRPSVGIIGGKITGKKNAYIAGLRIQIRSVWSNQGSVFRKGTDPVLV